MFDAAPSQPAELSPGDNVVLGDGSSTPPGRAARWRPLVTVLKYALLALVLWFVYVSMRNELRQTTLAELRATRLSWFWTAMCAVFLGLMNTVQMIRYRSLLRAYGATPTVRQMVAIAWIPPLGKYIPGSVWSLMGAITMLRRFGVNVTVAISVVLMVDAFSEIVGLLISVPLLIAPPFSDRWPAAQWAAPVLLTLGVIAMAPPIFGGLLRLALRLLGRPPLERMPTWGEYVVPVLTALAQWLFAGASLWCMTRALTPVSPALLPQFVMVASAAMALSYLVFIAPAGTGPRELIFVILLPSLLPDAPAGTVAIVTIAMRLIQILVELLLAGLGWVMLRFEVPPTPRPASGL